MALIKTPIQLKKHRVAGQYLTELLYQLKDATKAGVTLLELEFIAEKFMQKNNVKGSFKWHHGYPANLCLSVNDCVVHGIPDNYVLKNGDLIKIDGWVIYEGCLSDAAFSMIVGWENTNPRGAQLIRTTKEALDLGLQTVIAGRSLINFGRTVYDHVSKKWFTIVKTLTGHGIGTTVHERPFVYNYPEKAAAKDFFQTGMVLCLEPITAEKSTQAIERNDDGWSLFCEYGDMGCQREYMVEVTSNGPKVLAGIQENIY